MPLLNTAQKIGVASVLYRSVAAARKLLGKSDEVVVNRKGINWDLNLREGIDFSIYLLGGFELTTLRLYESLLRDSDVVLDIGANIGAHTLPMAKLVGNQGRVFAFEPTQYAFNKLKRNVEINADLESRIQLIHAMLVAGENVPVTHEIYSSWPLRKEEGLHAQHGGRLMSTAGAEVATLDNFVARAGLNRVDFIKLDVDGNEVAVLTGGMNTINRFRPRILMELAPYLFESNMRDFQKIIRTVFDLKYEVIEMANRRPLPRDLSALFAMVPAGGSMNVLFEPS